VDKNSIDNIPLVYYKNKSMTLKRYYHPKSINEALHILEKEKGKAQVIAGGTDLIIDLKNKKVNIDALVDITRIEGLSSIELKDDFIYIGALVTHSEIAKSTLIKKNAKVLALATLNIGSPQVRNLGTLPGNIVNARPAADGATALIALNALAEIHSTNGVRWEKIEDLYLEAGKSKVNPASEIITKIKFRFLSDNHGSSFQRLAKRKAMALPVLNCASVVEVDKKMDRFKNVKIVVGPVAPTPFRAKRAEDLLKDAKISKEIVAQAAEIASLDSQPRDSIRGGAIYRKDMVKVLVKRALIDSLKDVFLGREI